MPHSCPLPLPTAALTMLTTLLAVPLTAQGLDRDPTLQTQTLIQSNGTHHPYGQPLAVRPAHRITGPVTWTDLAVSIQDPLPNPPHRTAVDLVIEAGGHLKISSCSVQIFGNVYLKEGGRVEVQDSLVSIQNDAIHRFNYFWEGGHLTTLRTLIGGRKLENGTSQNTVFQVDRGLWVANDTTVQYSAGILLGEARTGFAGHSYLRGGTLIADGLHQGETPDALIMSGMGDAVLKNSVFNVNFYLYGDAPAPSAITLDLDTSSTIPLQVFGDPAVHDGTNRPPVNRPVPGSPYRLELNNTRVPFWWLSAFKVSPGNPSLDITLQNTNGLLINVHGENLTGSPVPVGPWNQHYATIPDLPSHSSPGQHAIPPGCGTRIGNVTFRAPAASPARVTAWGLYLRGASTDLTVRGPMKVAEIFLDAGRLTIEGTDQYDGRVLANGIFLHETGHLRIRNAAVGGMGLEEFAQGRIVVHGLARCELDTVLTRQLILSTAPEWFGGPHFGVNQGVITVANAIEFDPITSAASGQGVITVQRASANQSFDLQNLDLESGVRPDGVAGYFGGSNLAGYTSGTRRPGSGGNASFGYRSTQATGQLVKNLRLCPGTHLSVSGWLRPQAALTGTLQVRVSGAQHSTVLTPQLQTNQWSWFIVPLHQVRSGDTVTQVAIEHSGNTGTIDVLVDDLRIHPHVWWEWDNFANMDFEEPVQRNMGESPEFLTAPDFFAVWRCRTEVETSDRRPGSPGQRSLRVIPLGENHQVFKSITWLPPGRTVTIQGYMKGIPGSAPFTPGVSVGDGWTWWDLNVPSNRWVSVPADGTWRPFNLVYTVPANPTFTRITLLGGRPGDTILYDDLTVTLQ